MTHTDFFKFSDFRDFLQQRYALLKATKRGFSARTFCRLAKVSSPSYISLVIAGKRKLSVEYAKKFAAGLSLSRFETSCLTVAVAFEHASSERERLQLAHTLRKLKAQTVPAEKMNIEHLRILSIPWMLKLYLLPQSNQFELNSRWLISQFEGVVSEQELAEAIKLMFESKLWKQDGNKISTCAPIIKSGDLTASTYLSDSHKNFLEAAKNAIDIQNSKERVFGGRTFLFDKTRLVELSERINTFKQEIEAEFEDLNSANAYQLHISFFEIARAEPNVKIRKTT